MNLNLPAWLALRLKLSNTVAKTVPDDQLQTVFQYSKILAQNSSPTQGQLIEGNGLGQRSAALGRDTNSLLYPRCIKAPYKGPCRALEYKWSWSTEENGCVIYPYGGCVEEGVDIDGENSFDNKMDCVLKCAPIRDGKDKTEIASYLVAGDDEKAPQAMLPSPAISQNDLDAMRGSIPMNRVGYQLPTGNTDNRPILNSRATNPLTNLLANQMANLPANIPFGRLVPT